MIPESWFPYWSVFICLFMSDAMTDASKIYESGTFPLLNDSRTSSVVNSAILKSCFDRKPMETVVLLDIKPDRNNLQDVDNFLTNIAETLDMEVINNSLSFIKFSNGSLDFTRCENMTCVRNFIDVNQRLGNVTQTRLDMDYLRRTYVDRGSKKRRLPLFFLLVTNRINSEPELLSKAEFFLQIKAIITVVTYSVNQSEFLFSITSSPLREHFFSFLDSSFLPEEAFLDVASTMCEDISNYDMELHFDSNPHEEKRTYQGKNIIAQEKKVTSSKLWITFANTSATPFSTTIQPSHGRMMWNNTTLIVSELVPSTTYLVWVSMFNQTYSQQNRPILFVLTTAPPPIISMNMTSRYVSGKELSRELQLDLNSEWNNSLEESKYLNIIDIRWDTNSTSTKREVFTIPASPHAVALPKTSNRRIILNLFPGMRYEVQVITRVSRLEKITSSNSIVTAPLPPTAADFVRSGEDRIVVRWLPPEEAVFDSFLLISRSLSGREVVSVGADVARNRSYNHTFIQLRPGKQYLFQIFSKSQGVLSRRYAKVVYNPSLTIANRTSSFNPHNSLLLSFGDGIYYSPLDFLLTTESRNQSIINPPQKFLDVPSGVVDVEYCKIKDLEDSQEAFVWIDRGERNIKITYLTPTITTKTLIKDLVLPTSLAFDYSDYNLYWTDMGLQAIGVASLSDSMRFNSRLIYEGLVSPISIVIHSIDRRLYWGDLIGRIEMSRMDGSDRSILVNDSTLRPYGLTVCLESGNVYWINSLNGQLETLINQRRRIVLHRLRFFVPNSVYFLVSLQTKLLLMKSDDLSVISVDKLSISKSLQSGSSFDVNYYQLNFSGNPHVSSISTSAYQTYERVLLHVDDNITSPCFYDNGGCNEICISNTFLTQVCMQQCKPWEIRCGNSSTCISSLLICDGIDDCPDGHDEAGCIERNQSGNLSTESYLCGEGSSIINQDAVCDGRMNCRDGSEEGNCVNQHQHCDFEESLCLWNQDIHDDFDWTFRHGRTSSDATGPAVDHTLISSNSSYIYTEATFMDEDASVSLRSTTFERPVCVRFYYHMLGANVGSLNLLVHEMNSNRSVTVWRKDGNQGSFWKYAKVSVNKHGSYQLTLTSVRGSDYRSDIAIDDISIDSGLCSFDYNCSFDDLEDSICEPSNESNWRIYTETTDDFNITSSSAQSAANLSLITIDPLDLLGPDWFYFNFRYDNIPGCSSCNGTQLVRSLSSYSHPRFAGLVLCNTTRYKIYLSNGLREVFRNIADGSGRGEDHCEFVGAANPARLVGDVYTCSGSFSFARRWWGEPLQTKTFGHLVSDYLSPMFYECGLIIPQQVIDHDPENRHSNQRNAFLYFEENEGLDNESVVLTLPVYKEIKSKLESSCSENISSTRNMTDNETRQWCLTFRYFIRERNNNKFLLNMNGNITLWSTKGNQGSNWTVAAVPIPVPIIKYDLFFIAQGMGLGIDDVLVVPSPCYVEPNYVCHFNSPILTECAFIVINPDAVQYLLVDVLFERKLFSPIILKNSLNTTGVLNFTAPFNGNPVMLSPILPALNALYPVYCFGVDYMQKRDKGNLRIVLRSLVTGEGVELFRHRLSSLRGNRPWLTLRTEVNSSIEVASNGHFQLEFYGFEFAYIDAIYIETKSCPLPSEGFCNNGLFCGEGRCVSSQKLCDGFNDCGDWFDEIGCTSNCETVADLFGSRNTLVKNLTTSEFEHNQCVWRVHGEKGKQVLLEINEPYNGEKRFSIEVYKGLPRRPVMFNIALSFHENDLLFSKSGFYHERKFIFDESDITIALSLARTNLFYKLYNLGNVTVTASLVDKSYCSFVCENNHCLLGNRACDGDMGCLDGTDEDNCSRIVNSGTEKIFEIRDSDNDFAPLCADDVTPHIADIACKQAGFSGILNRNITSVFLPDRFSRTHRIGRNISSEIIFLHNHLYRHGVNGTYEECPSRMVWVPNCAYYQCGIRSGSSDEPQLRIVGGVTVRHGKWPWIAALRNGPFPSCGGTLISNKLVLTAAHCFDRNKPTEHEVILGTNNVNRLDSRSRIYKIKKATIHPLYNIGSEIPDHDIAIVELNQEVKFSRFISPACLADASVDIYPGKRCYIMGFGHLVEHGPHQNKLYEAQVPILSRQQCSQFYTTHLSRRMLCTGYQDRGGTGFCNGDSGGPLMCEVNNRWYLTGVISWSFGCAQRNRPDVFSDLIYFGEWLERHTGINLTISDQFKSGTCGGTYNERSGSFSSPGWPESYPNNAVCVWRVLAGPGLTAEITFEFFETEPYYDYVEFYHSGYNRQNLFANISGTYIGRRIKGVENQTIEIVFLSNYWRTFSGFYAKYNVIGTKQPYSGSLDNMLVTASNPSERSALLLVQTLSGLYRPIIPVQGSRPTYVKGVERNNETDDAIVMYYDENDGNWRINDADSRAWIHTNDSATTPDKITAEWLLILDSGQFSTLLFSVMPIPDDVTNSFFSSSCKYILNNGSGVIRVSNSSSHHLCNWFLHPVGNQSSSGFNWIVLIVEEISLPNVMRVFRGMDISAPPIYISSNTSNSANEEGSGSGFVSLDSFFFDSDNSENSTFDCLSCSMDDSMLSAALNSPSIVSVCEFMSSRCNQVTWCNVLRMFVTYKDLTNISFLFDLAEYFCSTNESESSARNFAVFFSPRKLALVYKDTVNSGITVSFDRVDPTSSQLLFHYHVYTQYFNPLLASYELNVVDIGFEAIGTGLVRHVRSAPALPANTSNISSNSGFRVNYDENSDQQQDLILFHCNFDENLCGFEDEVIVLNFRWSRAQYSTLSEMTGPDGDASILGNGWYLYLEASAPRHPGDRVQTVTPLLHSSPGSPVCIRFAYDMFGRATGFLNVYVILLYDSHLNTSQAVHPDIEYPFYAQPLVNLYGFDAFKESDHEKTSKQKFLVWSREGEQRQSSDPSWNNASVTFYPYHNFQIMFEGVRGQEFTSDIAIDNVVVSRGECDDKCQEENGFTSCFSEQNTFGSCVPSELQCDGVRDCPVGGDEVSCSHEVEESCREESNERNSSLGYLCSSEHLYGCVLPPNLSVSDLVCNGVYDCFGGYDEAGCQTVTQNKSKVVDAMFLDCGEQSLASPEESPSYQTNKTNLWPWVAGLYLVNPSSVASTNHNQTSDFLRYSFLCTAVFIHNTWAIVPAHCLLDPDTYQNFTRDLFEDITREPEFEEDFLNEAEIINEREVQSSYAYVIIRSTSTPAGESKSTWRVTKYIIHPNYNSKDEKLNSSNENFLGIALSEVNNDIALLKVEEENSAVIENEGPDFHPDEVEDSVDEFSSLLYDSETIDDNIEEPQNSACIEILKSKFSGERNVSSKSSFQMPSEQQRYSSTSRDESAPKKAYCVLVGHSPVYNNSSNQPNFLAVHHQKVFVTQADITGPELFCLSFRPGKTQNFCTTEFSSKNAADLLNPLIRAGYQSQLSAGFVYDHGVALFCKRFDNKWFLSGLSSKLNFVDGFASLNFSKAVNEPSENQTSMRVQLGTTYLTSVTTDISEWINNTLFVVCPGEFSCYPERQSVQRCISLNKVCDGIVDCNDSYTDETSCDSKCYYDPNSDPIHLYNTNKMPCQKVNSSVSQRRHSWRNVISNERDRIKFNKVNGTRVKNCNWILNPPEGKVAVIKVPKISVNPILAIEEATIITGTTKHRIDWSSGPHYYTSQPGKPITFKLAPERGRIYFSDIRNWEFEYFIEDPGLCSEQHSCSDGKCVSPRKLCDGSFDCQDLSDEDNCPSGCEGRSLHLNASQGSLFSRNYPSLHNGNGNCLWIISYPNNEVYQYEVNLYFRNFTSHINDKLFVFTGVGRSKVFFASYFGNFSLTNVTIPSNQITVLLQSNDHVEDRTFHIDFFVVPKEEINR